MQQCHTQTQSARAPRFAVRDICGLEDPRRLAGNIVQEVEQMHSGRVSHSAQRSSVCARAEEPILLHARTSEIKLLPDTQSATILLLSCTVWISLVIDLVSAAATLAHRDVSQRCLAERGARCTVAAGKNSENPTS